MKAGRRSLPVPPCVVTQVTLIALFAHVWVGMRDLWMDYIKPVGLRLTMHVFTHCLAGHSGLFG